MADTQDLSQKNPNTEPEIGLKIFENKRVVYVTALYTPHEFATILQPVVERLGGKFEIVTAIGPDGKLESLTGEPPNVAVVNCCNCDPSDWQEAFPDSQIIPIGCGDCPDEKEGQRMFNVAGDSGDLLSAVLEAMDEQ